MKSLLGYSIFLFSFTAPSVFVGFKNVSALENKNSSIKGMCQKWSAIHGQFALQSWSYYDCYEFEAKVQVKTIEKKTSFFIHADCFYVRVRKGFAQIWCSDPFEPMVISRSRCNFGPRLPLPRSHFPVPRSTFSILRSPFPFSVHRSSLQVSSLFLVLRFSSPVLRSLLE